MSLKTGIVAMALALALAGAVFVFATRGGPVDPDPVEAATRHAGEPLKRSDPGVEPWKEPRVPLQEPEEAEKTKPEMPPEPKEAQPKPQVEPPPEPPPEPESALAPKPGVEASYEPEPVVEPEPIVEPAAEPAPRSDPPAETDPDPKTQPDPYELPDGAIMALSVEAIGLREIPVFDSTGAWALKYGVGHDPDTSLPWNDSPHKNVYVAGHKVGFPGTASDRVFDELGDLGRGDGVVLRGAGGEKYRYEVTESFEASPEDSWVTSRLRGEDIVTLQTCVGPSFSKRLIVRAERV